MSDNRSSLFAPGGLHCEAADGRAPTLIDSIVGENLVAGVNFPVSGCAAAYTLSNPVVPDLGTNTTGDPQFIGGPNGWFYLNPSVAGGSVAIDRGSIPASTSSVAARTTSPSEAPDADVIDLGYHHAIGPIRPSFVDTDGDGFDDDLDSCPDEFNLFQSRSACE